MQAPVEICKDLVLIGGGHAHALVLRMMAMTPVAGLRITLISPASHTPYSGMLPGLVAGHYQFEHTHIDLSRLCTWAQVRFITSEVIALDTHKRVVSLRDRPPLAYDVLSIDIGSQPELDSVPGAKEHVTPVKPVAQLWQRWQTLTARYADAKPGPDHRITVVGGGAGGIELALAIAQFGIGKGLTVELLSAASGILAGYNAGARRATLSALTDLGVELQLDSRVAKVEAGLLHLADGRQLSFDELFWCTGAAAAPWVAESGLPVDERGFLKVSNTLQSQGDKHIFAAGDIATQVQYPRPKAGVYAVRQAPVLAHNLRNIVLGKPLREHRPQLHFLSLISLGAKRATADRGLFCATGEWVWRWKNRIDRSFMARFEDLPQMPQGQVPTKLPELEERPSQPACGGCGAKVGARGLSAVLASLASNYPQLCPDVSAADDAALIHNADSGQLLQSIDVLREIVADPWLMGRIVANHALSDLYACGARPTSALAAVTLPFASADILQRDLYQLMAGAMHEFAEVNCRLLGGHSLQGPELSLGFVVNGLVPSTDKIMAKRGLCAGDKLLLTKPLGTGVLFAAQMQLLADGRDITKAVEGMLHSSAVAAELAKSHGVAACTDVTGFGLAGHLLEMLQGEQVAVLQLSKMPALDGALEQLRAGVRSSMHSVNAQVLDEIERSGEVAPEHLDLLFDPQTSGGLLFGVPAQNADSLLEALREAGYSRAAIIGDIMPRRANGSAIKVV